MKSEAVRIAEIQSRDKTIAEVMGFAKNPIIIILLVFIAVEYLQGIKIGEQKGWFGRISEKYAMGENVGTMLEAAIVAGPVLTSLAASSAEALKGLASMVPLLATKGAAG